MWQLICMYLYKININGELAACFEVSGNKKERCKMYYTIRTQCVLAAQHIFFIAIPLVKYSGQMKIHVNVIFHLLHIISHVLLKHQFIEFFVLKLHLILMEQTAWRWFKHFKISQSLGSTEIQNMFIQNAWSHGSSIMNFYFLKCYIAVKMFWHHCYYIEGYWCTW